MITKERYEKLRLAIDEYENFTRKNFTKRGGFVVMDKDDQKLAKVHVGFTITNEMRSDVETYEFMTQKPKEYVGYVRENKLINWMGIEYGTIKFLTNSSRPSILVKAINGVTYKGSYFKSSGDYCRLKAVKK